MLVKGSGPEPYKLQYNRETNVYSCTCTVWRHVPVRNNEKTCRHLWSIRGRDVEMGRVGEEGIAKMEKAEAELRRKNAPPGGGGGDGRPSSAATPGCRARGARGKAAESRAMTLIGGVD